MLLSAAILLLGCSSALADGHVNNMGCCEQKNVPGHFYVLLCKMIVSLWIDDFMNVPNPIQGQCPSLGFTSWIPNTPILFRTSASMHLFSIDKLPNRTCAQGQLRVREGDNGGADVNRGDQVLLQAELDVHRRVPGLRGHRGARHRDNR